MWTQFFRICVRSPGAPAGCFHIALLSCFLVMSFNICEICMSSCELITRCQMQALFKCLHHGWGELFPFRTFSVAISFLVSVLSFIWCLDFFLIVLWNEILIYTCRFVRMFFVHVNTQWIWMFIFSPLYSWLIVMQFYTFLETTLVTISLLPQFIAFFNDGEIPGSPSSLAATFLAFGNIKWTICFPDLLAHYTVLVQYFFISCKNILLTSCCSLELGICLECYGISDHAHILSGS